MSPATHPEPLQGTAEGSLAPGVQTPGGGSLSTLGASAQSQSPCESGYGRERHTGSRPSANIPSSSPPELPDLRCSCVSSQPNAGGARSPLPWPPPRATMQERPPEPRDIKSDGKTSLAAGTTWATTCNPSEAPGGGACPGLCATRCLSALAPA